MPDRLLGPQPWHSLCPVGPADGHGTEVAGVIAGPTGVAPGAKIVAIKIFPSKDATNASCSDTASFSDIFTGMNFAIMKKAEFGIAVINLQVAVYRALDVGLTSSPFATMFFTVTGAFMIAVLVGLVFAVVTAFRSLGGRYAATDTDGVAAFALYWHFLAVAYVAVWFIVYVNK
jgi:subtilisin family serine protease